VCHVNFQSLDTDIIGALVDQQSLHTDLAMRFGIIAVQLSSGGGDFAVPTRQLAGSFGDRRSTFRCRRRVLIPARMSDPARPSSQLKALAPKCRGDGCMRDTVVSTKPRQGFTGCVESCCLIDLYAAQALAADGDALLAEHVGDAGLGDSVASTDLLSGFAYFVAIHDVSEVLGGQEAFGAGFWTVLGRSGWSCL
jgi:hypothetical protein